MIKTESDESTEKVKVISSKKTKCLAHAHCADRGGRNGRETETPGLTMFAPDAECPGTKAAFLFCYVDASSHIGVAMCVTCTLVSCVPEVVFDFKTAALHGVRGRIGGTPHDNHRARGGMDKTSLADAHTFGRLFSFV